MRWFVRRYYGKIRALPLAFVDGNDGLESENDPSVASDIVRPFSPQLVGFFLPLVKVAVKSGQLNRRYPAE